MLGTKQAFISAYLKGEESRLITSEHVDRMSKASSIQEALGVIRGTDIGSYLEENPVRTFDDIDERLWVYFSHCLGRLEWFRLVPGDILKILRAYVVKYDVLNIKASLQRVSGGGVARMVPAGVIQNCGLLDRLPEAGGLSDIIEVLRECKLRNYAAILEENVERINGGVKSRLSVEAELDREYYRSLLDIAGTVQDGPLLLKAIGFVVDLTNLQIIARAVIEGIGPKAAEYIISGGYVIPDEAVSELLSLKLGDISTRLENTRYRDVAREILSGYERTKSIAVVDEIIEKRKFELVKETLSLRVLSPLVVAWYLILKEVELRNLRLILKAMVDGVPLGEVKDYLVLVS